VDPECGPVPRKESAPLDLVGAQIEREVAHRRRADHARIVVVEIAARRAEFERCDPGQRVPASKLKHSLSLDRIGSGRREVGGIRYDRIRGLRMVSAAAEQKKKKKKKKKKEKKKKKVLNSRVAVPDAEHVFDEILAALPQLVSALVHARHNVRARRASLGLAARINRREISGPHNDLGQRQAADIFVFAARDSLIFFKRKCKGRNVRECFQQIAPVKVSIGVENR
jgi:hypothetical protein